MLFRGLLFEIELTYFQLIKGGFIMKRYLTIVSLVILTAMLLLSSPALSQSKVIGVSHLWLAMTGIFIFIMESAKH